MGLAVQTKESAVRDIASGSRSPHHPDLPCLWAAFGVALVAYCKTSNCPALLSSHASGMRSGLSTQHCLRLTHLHDHSCQVPKLSTGKLRS